MRIYRCLVTGVAEVGQDCLLNEDETRHLFDVLRVSPGDIVEVLDGNGLRARGEAVAPKGRRGPLVIKITEILERVTERSQRVPPITLEIAAIKGDGMEWILEKATELGIDRVVPLITDHTVIQMNHGGPEKYQIRWQRVADQALKQCGRLFRLNVDLPISLQDYFAQPKSQVPGVRLWANETHPDRDKRSGHLVTALDRLGQKPMSLLVGPEGGWSAKEVEHLRHEQLEEVHLGISTLRAETAALYSMSLALRNWI